MAVHAALDHCFCRLFRRQDLGCSGFGITAVLWALRGWPSIRLVFGMLPSCSNTFHDVSVISSFRSAEDVRGEGKEVNGAAANCNLVTWIVAFRLFAASYRSILLRGLQVLSASSNERGSLLPLVVSFRRLPSQAMPTIAVNRDSFLRELGSHKSEYCTVAMAAQVDSMLSLGHHLKNSL